MDEFESRLAPFEEGIEQRAPVRGQLVYKVVQLLVMAVREPDKVRRPCTPAKEKNKTGRTD